MVKYLFDFAEEYSYVKMENRKFTVSILKKRIHYSHFCQKKEVDVLEILKQLYSKYHLFSNGWSKFYCSLLPAETTLSNIAFTFKGERN